MGARRSRPRRSGLGLQVDLLTLGSKRAHVVAEMGLQRSPGFRRRDADLAGCLSRPFQVFGDLAGAPGEDQAGLVVAEWGNGAQPLFQVIAGELQLDCQRFARVAERNDVALDIGRAVELDVGQVGYEFLQARGVRAGLSHRWRPFGLVG